MLNSTQVFDAIWNWGTTILMGVIFVRMLGWIIVESYIDLKDRWDSRNLPAEETKDE